jgi:starch-binding outer membrane protein, SusD/RagB family
MKILFNKTIFISLMVLMTIFIACKKSYLDTGALGTVSATTLSTKDGVNGLLIGAYSLLDGKDVAGVSNWVYGGVASDDAHTGVEANLVNGAISPIENYTVNASSNPLNGKWGSLYAGIQRANEVLRILPKVPSAGLGSLTDDERKQVEAEAIFLRGVYHLEAAKIWRNIPYVDETISFANGNFNVPNTNTVWSFIEADFQRAAENLTDIKTEVGRANKWAAKAFLAKTYMFQNKFAEAKPLLEDIILNGVTSSGAKYALVNFADNFNPAKKNGPESVFAVQMSVKDGANGLNGRSSDQLNFPIQGPSTCCSAYQPSFSLVNSFKTDTNGLPLIYSFNDADITNDQGLSSSDPFVPYDGPLDPRLDYTVGRRGIPYLDWGIHPGQSWIKQQSLGGPYSPIKNLYYQSQASTSVEGDHNTYTSNNYTMIRFADVLLWAAEVEVEVGSLSQAEAYVNLVRARAANPEGWVKKYIDDQNPLAGFTDVPAANYVIGLYAGQFEQGGKDFAREAVRFERKLEFAMEGHRFFDLQRYNDQQPGYMSDVLNAYILHETSIPGYNFEYMKNAQFVQGKNELFPIPQSQIDLSMEKGSPTLVQNPGY